MKPRRGDDRRRAAGPRKHTIGALAAPALDVPLAAIRMRAQHVLSAGEADDEARPILQALDETWARWPADCRLRMLATLEHLDRATKARRQRSARYRRRAYAQLVSDALAAARLVKRLTANGPLSAVGTLVGPLAEFVNCAVVETSELHPWFSAAIAQWALDELERRTAPYGRAPRELMASLLWLRQGKRGQPLHEASIRRLLRRRRTPGVLRPWKQHWRLVQEVVGLRHAYANGADHEAAQDYVQARLHPHRRRTSPPVSSPHRVH